MQTLTPRQLLSARVFLGLTQQHLAVQLGISIPTMIRWEKDGNQIPENKIPIIKLFFDKHNIEFFEDRGFFRRNTRGKSYCDKQGICDFLDSMYYELKQNKDLEICILGVDEQQLLKRLDFASQYIRKIQHLNPNMRVIHGPLKSESLLRYQDYKIMEPARIDLTPICLYGNKVALIHWEPLEVVITEEPAHYQIFKNLFEQLWSNLDFKQHQDKFSA